VHDAKVCFSLKAAVRAQVPYGLGRCTPLAAAVRRGNKASILVGRCAELATQAGQADECTQSKATGSTSTRPDHAIASRLSIIDQAKAFCRPDTPRNFEAGTRTVRWAGCPPSAVLASFSLSLSLGQNAPFTACDGPWLSPGADSACSATAHTANLATKSLPGPDPAFWQQLNIPDNALAQMDTENYKAWLRAMLKGIEWLAYNRLQTAPDPLFREGKQEYFKKWCARCVPQVSTINPNRCKDKKATCVRIKENFQYLAGILGENSEDWYLVRGRTFGKTNHGLSQNSQPHQQDILHSNIQKRRASKREHALRYQARHSERKAQAQEARGTVSLQGSQYPLLEPEQFEPAMGIELSDSLTNGKLQGDENFEEIAKIDSRKKKHARRRKEKREANQAPRAVSLQRCDIRIKSARSQAA
jgi:hypothetical protein